MSGVIHSALITSRGVIRGLCLHILYSWKTQFPHESGRIHLCDWIIRLAQVGKQLQSLSCLNIFIKVLCYLVKFSVAPQLKIKPIDYSRSCKVYYCFYMYHNSILLKEFCFHSFKFFVSAFTQMQMLRYNNIGNSITIGMLAKRVNLFHFLFTS